MLFSFEVRRQHQELFGETCPPLQHVDRSVNKNQQASADLSSEGNTSDDAATPIVSAVDSLVTSHILFPGAFLCFFSVDLLNRDGSESNELKKNI